jgi:hypothetical protein
MGILAHNTHVTYNGIASALAAAAAGGLLTNILCVICQKLVNSHLDLILAAFFGLHAIRKIEQISFSYYINSICVAFYSCGCYAIYLFVDTVVYRTLLPRCYWKFY